MSNRCLGIIIVLTGFTSYCSDLVPLNTLTMITRLVDKRGLKRKPSGRVNRTGIKKQKSELPKKTERTAIITYKDVPCYLMRRQWEFFEKCKKKGWELGSLEGLSYTVPEDCYYCPLRVKDNCPYLLSKIAPKNYITIHMKRHHSSSLNQPLQPLIIHSSEQNPSIEKSPLKGADCMLPMDDAQ